ncbi:hypothetical protein PENTCL1PPCAC_19752, partial [Pristionchus entomophagus]
KKRFPLLDFSSVLVMSANIREVRIDAICTSLEATDLLYLRNAVLRGNCKMEMFDVTLKPGVGNEFIKTCFAVDVDDQQCPDEE